MSNRIWNWMIKNRAPDLNEILAPWNMGRAMSKLAHSNQETMDKIEADARERDERGEPDESSLRSCATCGAILAPGPQPAATYAPLRLPTE